MSVIRAFSYFSHLANIAEDRHHVRRRAHPRARRATCRKARWRWRFERLRAARHRAPPTSRATLAHAYISPVLTAHPTEVQRKSILDAERAIAELLGERDGLRRRDARAAPTTRR